MRRLFIILVLLFPCHSVFAKAPPPPYCEGPRIIVDAPLSGLLTAVQEILDQHESPQYLYNGRYEICLQITDDEPLVFRAVDNDRKLIITNTSNREVVIGFLKANRLGDSSLPIIEVHGTKVTIFQPTFSNVKKAIVFDGNRHKLVGGTINGVPNAADSLCVDGTGNNIEVKDATINDCVNAIRLNGNRSVVQNVSIYPHQSDYAVRDLESDEERQTRILEGRRIWPSGVCLSLQGNDGAIRNTVLEKCYGVGIKVSGQRHRIVGNRIIGETPYADDVTKYSTDCFQLAAALNINVESQEFAHCQKGIHVLDSQSIYIGPERFENFATKKNDIHHNDYAIHAERSQTVYARHNQVYENGNSLPQEEAYNFGFWLAESNLIFNGGSQVLPFPKMEPADGVEKEEEYPVVKYDASGNAFVDVRIPVQTGKIELSFPPDTSLSNTDIVRTRYQSHTPFADCAFENATIESNGFGKVRCPIQVTSEIKGKRLLAVLHGNPVGSSQYAKALGVINDPTGIPVSGSAPTTGNMSGGVVTTGGAQAGHANPAGTSGGGGGAPGCGGSIVGEQTAGEKTMKGYFVLWYISIVILFVLRWWKVSTSPNPSLQRRGKTPRRHLWSRKMMSV